LIPHTDRTDSAQVGLTLGSADDKIKLPSAATEAPKASVTVRDGGIGTVAIDGRSLDNTRLT
jgi:hypothetical protein